MYTVPCLEGNGKLCFLLTYNKMYYFELSLSCCLQMEEGSRVRLTEVNPYLVCVLCHGYLVDATTIAECLHSCEYSLHPCIHFLGGGYQFLLIHFD